LRRRVLNAPGVRKVRLREQRYSYSDRSATIQSTRDARQDKDPLPL
jgi:hypothetical protein